MSVAEKIKQARELLAVLGFGSAQTNERSARVLVALLELKPYYDWSAAQNPRMGVRAIADWIRAEWEFDYAENSRESIRRFTLHQFIEAGLVIYNEDDPNRPTNSSLNNYRIAPEALEVIREYGAPTFGEALSKYLLTAPGLKAKYGAARTMARIPVKLPDGSDLTLGAGGQNVLLKAMVEDFCAYFIPGGEVIYIGDADAKLAVFDEEKLASLGVRVNHHGKLPDLVVYQAEKNWLFLMEAASTHGPVDAKRYGELSTLFAGLTAGLVYVSCFPSRATMRKFLSDLAWETEVWNADEPTHMIHLNGSRFMGPYDPRISA
jgi:hypothetical protein